MTAEQAQAIHVRMVNLESALIVLRGELDQSRAEVVELKGKKNKTRFSISSSKALDKVPKYNGKVEDFATWKYKMKIFLGSENGEFTEFLRWVEDQPDQITNDDMDIYPFEAEDVKELNDQLYNVLALNLLDSPLALIRNLEDETKTRGANSWWKVVKDAVGMTGSRLQALTSKVNSPVKVKMYKDVTAALENWETNLREYERVVKTTVPDIAKLTALRQLVPKELDMDIGRLNTLNTYTDARKYVFEQVSIRREPYIDPGHHGPTPMDVSGLDHTYEKCSPGDGGDGQSNNNEKCNSIGGDGSWTAQDWELFYAGVKGKGKGKGRFGGTCYHCGQPGHMLKDCWLKDAEMKGKGKGKGQEKGGKGYNKGGYGKSYGKGQWNMGKGYNKGGHGGTANAFGFYSGTPPLGWIDNAPSTAHSAGESGNGYDQWASGPPLFALRAERTATATSSMWTAFADEIPEDEVDDELPLDEVIDDGFPDVRDTMHIKKNNEKMPQWKDPKKNKSKNNHEDLLINMLENEKIDDEKWEELWKRGAEKMQQASNKRTAKVHQPIEKNMHNCNDVYQALEIDVLESESTDELVNNVEQWKQSDGGWTRIQAVIDSGAAESVAPMSMAPREVVYESAGSRRKQHYLSASGKRMPNLGEQRLKVTTNDGRETGATFQMVDVSRPLCSVSKICATGKRVIFGASGGAIHDLSTGEITPFGKSDGVYTLDLWLNSGEERGQGFPRQGM